MTKRAGEDSTQVSRHRLIPTDTRRRSNVCTNMYTIIITGGELDVDGMPIYRTGESRKLLLLSKIDIPKRTFVLRCKYIEMTNNKCCYSCTFSVVPDLRNGTISSPEFNNVILIEFS